MTSFGHPQVAKLDRLSRSVRTALDIADRAKANGWALFMLDIGGDTATAAGRGVVSMLATVAELERGLIWERTRAALAARKRKERSLDVPPRCHVSALLAQRVATAVSR